ncbi:hypothetical protein CEY16_10180 [Halalkalibacillus sediminis]|uniref:HlyC/CorC family transporter n=1 Tax=Halalkalibacillus sediminis TaxID=2018042 RepID=A0A2I0QRX6_9BACI|nr:hemolysin family protein [Halalkalibacillus sediminis]PKR77105.1 hypothetical protein CEY16_10180 [Halalkalibacillus sediminis]
MEFTTVLYLILIVILIALTAFFVASEFAIVKIRGSKIDHLIESGDKRALAAQKVVNQLDEYLSACQLGITITALGLGWIGEPTVERILHPVFGYFSLPSSVTSVLSFGIAFFIITFLHVVVGELAPKTLAIQKAEKITMLVAKPLIWFYRIMFPLIWLLNGSARQLTKLFGLHAASEHEVAHSEEELRIILSESYQKGEINQSEYRYVNRIFEFDNRVAKEIMVPRTEMETFEQHETVKQFLGKISESKFTRYPVVDGDNDHVIGLINVKQVANSLLSIDDYEKEFIQSYVRPIIRVIETMPIKSLLKKMQKDQIHMAVLVDEYGGTSGIVTVEDILEEIVGEIQDEFDEEEEQMIEKLNESSYRMDGRVLIHDVNEIMDLDINMDGVDTLGGWLMTLNPELDVGDQKEYNGVYFKVLEVGDYTVRRVEVEKQSS